MLYWLRLERVGRVLPKLAKAVASVSTCSAPRTVSKALETGWHLGVNFSNVGSITYVFRKSLSYHFSWPLEGTGTSKQGFQARSRNTRKINKGHRGCGLACDSSMSKYNEECQNLGGSRVCFGGWMGRKEVGLEAKANS